MRWNNAKHKCKKCAFTKKKTRKRKKKTQHDNLEVAFITNDQTFQLFNKQG